jgi:hypothetical protein
MTNKEYDEFFEKVKGKRIKYNYWDHDQYFIPYKQEISTIYGRTNNGKTDWWGIWNGFEPTTGIISVEIHWEYSITETKLGALYYDKN